MMIYKYYLIKWMKYCLIFLYFQIYILSLSGCTNRFADTCVKDGKVYCITDEWIFSENWYSCYLRGISCTQGGCWENARDEFLRAATKREQDGRWVRTYGMHRLPEYFPNRELGIAYYRLNDLDNALKYLTISLEQCESAKAKFYINKARKEKLLLTREDQRSPELSIDSYPETISTTKLLLSGLARDDTFVANILIKINDEEFLSLMELSQPQFKIFQKKIILRPGINDVLIMVFDLMGNQKEQSIQVLVDQEGPVIYFADLETGDPFATNLVHGLVYDPSGVTQFYLNDRKVALTKIDDNSKADSKESYAVYSFQHQLSLQELQKDFWEYETEDSLKNVSTGTIKILKEEHQANHRPIRIAMASRIVAGDYEMNPVFNQLAYRRSLDPIQIKVSQFPEETFEEEVCPQIEILARDRIREIAINEESILSIYGIHWTKFFDRIIKKYMDGKGEGRFLFNRMIKLKEGENIVNFKVVDESGKVWEKLIRIIKKTKKIHQLKERWRMAIPFITYGQTGDNNQEQREKELTYQLIEAFVNQGRFKVIELESLPIIIDERNLPYYLGRPLLGLSSDSRIWIDTFLLGYIQESEDSITLSASMVDLDTGEILATKDVCEEIDSAELVWHEGLMEHTFQICSILATKFKVHFPLCEGTVISLTGAELKTGICKNDGLKEGMKLLLYKGNLDHEEDFIILGDAKVKEVKKEYSLATLLENLQDEDINGKSINWGVITR